MRKLKGRKHVFVASGLKDFVPIQKIEEHNGVKYLLTPIFKLVIDVSHRAKYILVILTFNTKMETPIGENYLSYIMKTCNDFGIDYSVYIDQNKIKPTPILVQ